MIRGLNELWTGIELPLFYKRGVRICFLGAIFGLGLMGLQPAVGFSENWDEGALREYSRNSHCSEFILIRRLQISQINKPLTLYNFIGKEEARRQLLRRPILAPARPEGPFTRGTDFAARISRDGDIQITLALDLIRVISENHAIATQRVEQIYLRLKPSNELKLLEAKNGKFQLTLLRSWFCSEAVFEYASDREQHILTLYFINKKKPVSLETPQL